MASQKPYTNEQTNVDLPTGRSTTKPKQSTPATAVFARLGDVLKANSKGLVRWGRANSLWPMQFCLACCSTELMDFGSSHIDAERAGILFKNSPRHADVMIVAGWTTKQTAERVKKLYEQMAEPKYVIAYGACAISGGPWYESYNAIIGIDQILPVDVYVAGCPPKPENLFKAFMKLQDKISGKIAGNTERSISENTKRA